MNSKIKIFFKTFPKGKLIIYLPFELEFIKSTLGSNFQSKLFHFSFSIKILKVNALIPNFKIGKYYIPILF